MKKLLLTALAMLCTVSFAACSAQESEPESTDPAETLITAETTAEPVISEAEWKAAYKAFLLDKGYENVEAAVMDEFAVSFSLGYVDNDDIPELFVSNGHVRPTGVSVFTYSNGEVKFLCTGGAFGSIQYMEKSGFVCSNTSSRGNQSYDVYEIKNGECTRIHLGIDTSGATEDPALQKRTIDDKDVSEEEMAEFVAKYFKNENIKYNYDPDSIEDRLRLEDTENIEKVFGDSNV